MANRILIIEDDTAISQVLQLNLECADYIVTTFDNGLSDGNIARITRADFSSEEEFLFWKSWSDADYKETDYADSYFHRHTVGLDTIGDNAGNIPSPEEVLLYKTEREEQVQEAMELVQLIAKSLTKVQFRRLWLHHVQLENVRTIAKAEGVAHPSIVASITSAQRKILKIVQKHATKEE